MKKLFIIILVLFSVSAFSQRTLAVDTIQGAETVSFATMIDAVVIQAVCTELGGTSDGTLSVFGSIDGTNWTYLNMNDHTLGVASPWASIVGADTTSQSQITIVDALVASWTINTDLYRYTKVVGVGDTGDTTRVQIYYRR